MILNINKVPKKVIFIILLSTLQYNEAQANPFKELKKLLKNQNQANVSQSQGASAANTPQGAQSSINQSSASAEILDDDDQVKVGADQWVEKELIGISNPKVKKETAKNAAIMDAFYKQYPSLPINYTHKSYFVKNIQDKKYDLIDQIDIKEKMTPGATMGQPDPSKDQYSYQAKIKFKHKNLPQDLIFSIIQDSRSIYSSSSDSVWDANLGMQIPKDLKQARARAVHAAVESYYLTPFPTTFNYGAVIEKVDVVEEKIEYGFPISKVLVTFKLNPSINVEQLQNESLPGYAEIINAKKSFYQEKVKYLEQSAKIINLNFNLATLEKYKKDGSSFGSIDIETQLKASFYEDEAESGIAQAIKNGKLSDQQKKDFDAVNQQRLNNANTLRLKAQKSAELINLGGRSKQGLNQLAVPFIALTVMQRANGIATQEEGLVKKLNLQLSQKPSVVSVDQGSKKNNEDLLGE